LFDGFVLLSIGLTSGWTVTGLWFAVIASGIYHGINPGMGWPLAVAAGLMARNIREVWRALVPLALGHFAAMGVILLPFALLTGLVDWQREIRLVAAFGLIAFGIYRYFQRRHPRALARIKPSQLGLWSFVVAIAHGAALMLVPVYLGLCASIATDSGHAAAAQLMAGNIGVALMVAVVHSAAMIASGGALALAVYRWLGASFISKSWFNLDGVWAITLILMGIAGVWAAW
jgi:hypothetical protein